MKVQKTLETVFPSLADNGITDAFIEANEDVMWLEGDVDLMIYVPAYLHWCTRKKEKGLVDNWTLNALAEFGRAKDDGPPHLRFMHLCNAEQKSAVIGFLEWCSKEFVSVDKGQLERALRNWRKHVGTPTSNSF